MPRSAASETLGSRAPVTRDRLGEHDLARAAQRVDRILGRAPVDAQHIGTRRGGPVDQPRTLRGEDHPHLLLGRVGLEQHNHLAFRRRAVAEPSAR